MKIPRRLYLAEDPLPLWQALVGNAFESALNLDAFLIHLANPGRRRSKTDTTWGTVADLLQRHPELANDYEPLFHLALLTLLNQPGLTRLVQEGKTACKHSDCLLLA